MTDDLPPGWVTTTLGEICSKPQYGWTCRAATEGQIKYLRTTDISGGQIDWETVPFCEDAPEDIEKYRVQPEDILVSRAGSVGVSYRIANVPYDAVFASYLIRFKPLDGIQPQWVEMYLKSDSYWSDISEFSAGIAVPNVNASKLASLEMPLAPLGEQRRIGAKLDALFDRLTACQQRLDKIPALLKRFRQSVLAAACSGRLTTNWREDFVPTETSEQLLMRIRRKKAALAGGKRNAVSKPLDDEVSEIPASWAWARLDEVTAFVADIDHKMPKAVSKGVKFLSAKDLLDDGSLNFDEDVKQISEEDYERLSRKAKPRRNDIIYSRIGTVGKARLVTTDQPFLVSYSCCVIRPLLMVPGFVCRYLDSGKVLELARAAAQSIGVPDLGLQAIKDFAVPVPPLAEQEEILRRVDTLFDLAGDIGARFEKARDRVENLMPSLLAKAFRGNLVPQDPNDEPAATLLERIKAKRCKPTTTEENPARRVPKRRVARRPA